MSQKYLTRGSEAFRVTSCGGTRPLFHRLRRNWMSDGIINPSLTAAGALFSSVGIRFGLDTTADGFLDYG